MFDNLFSSRRPESTRRTPKSRALRLETLEDRMLLTGGLVAIDDAARIPDPDPDPSKARFVDIDVLANDTLNGQSIQSGTDIAVFVSNQGDTLPNSFNLLQPAHGHVDIQHNNPDEIRYTSDATFVGQDSFQYEVESPVAGLLARATVTITVVAGGPVARDDAAQTGINQAVTIAVLGNDSGPASLAGAGDPAHGSVTLNPGGTVTYTPAANFVGTDSFTYTIINSAGSSATATVTVQVLPQTTPPEAVTDVAVAPLGQPVVIAVLANDSNPAGGTLRVTVVRPPHDGTAVANADGTVTYTPRAGFTGTDGFEYRVQNDQGGSDSAPDLVAVGLSQDATFIAAAYARLLGREPDPAGGTNLLKVMLALEEIDELKEDQAAAEIDARLLAIQGIQNSDEFRQKQVVDLYQELLRVSAEKVGAKWQPLS